MSELIAPPLVYVAGPFSASNREGVEANIRAAERWGLEVARHGGMPVIPHANTSMPAFEEVQPYQFWIRGTLALLRACDAVLMIPGWKKSSGARGECADARFRGMRVFDGDDVEALYEWIEEWMALP